MVSLTPSSALLMPRRRLRSPACLATQLTFTDQLGRSLGKGNELDAATRQEARKLAFYLFYNCNASLQRCARRGGQPMAAY